MASGVIELLKGTDPGAAPTNCINIWPDSNGDIWRGNESGVDVMIYGNYICRAYNSGSQSMADAVVTYLTLDSELYDPAGMHSTVTNTSRITMPIAGVYYVGCCVRFADNTTGYRQVSIQINRSQNIFLHRVSPAPSGNPTIMTVGGLYTFVANDYIEIAAVHAAGTSINSEVSSGGVAPSMWAARIGD